MMGGMFNEHASRWLSTVAREVSAFISELRSAEAAEARRK